MLTRQPDYHTPHTVLRLAPGEVWCRNCGNAGNTSQARTRFLDRYEVECPVCGHQDWIAAEDVLRPGEYLIAN